MNIYQRINEIRKKIKYIQKDKQVRDYKAVTHDAVTAVVRAYLIEFGVLIVPQVVESVVVDTGHVTSSGTTILRYEARYLIDFVNIDKPEEKITIPIDAHANDTNDKAPGKAISYATKYAVLKLFNIETGENEESRMEGVNKEIQEIQETIESYEESINKIIEYINLEQLDAAAEIYAEIPKDILMKIWIAPTKAKKLGIDPPFTTKERAVLHSDEFGKHLRDYKQRVYNEQNIQRG